MAEPKKKRTSGTGDKGAIQDIPHEEVQVTEEKKTDGMVTVITIDQQIRNEIAKFNVADAAIAEMKKQYGDLVINGQEDKAGYKAVREAWGLVRSVRTGLEKKGLELRKDYQVITKAISGEENRLIVQVTPLEEDLYKKWKAIDDEKERIKKEKEEEEQKQLMARIEELQVLGMAFNDGFYRIGDTIAMDVATLRSLPDDQYDKLKIAVTNKAAEIKKADEDARLKKQQEDDELKRQQDELKKQQDELKKQQDQLRLQQEQMDKDRREAAKLKLEMRSLKLAGLGMVIKDGNAKFDNGFDGFTESLAEVTEMDEATFTKFLEETTGHIKDIMDRKAIHDEQVRKENEEKDRREKYIHAEMQAAGMVFNFGAKEFEFKAGAVHLRADFNLFAGLSDEEIASVAKDFKTKVKEAKDIEAKAEKERQKEADRQGKLALTDKQRWAETVQEIDGLVGKIDPNHYKTKTYQDKAKYLRERLSTFVNEFK